MGQPFGDSSAIPTYYISRQIRQHVKVCLSGDGGDEMFGGYDFFQNMLQVDRVAGRVPAQAYRWGGDVAQRLGELPPFRSLRRLRQIRQVCDTCAAPYEERFQKLAPRFDARELRRLLRPEWLQTRGIDVEAVIPTLRGGDDPTRLRRLMAYRMKYSLPEDMLVKVDRMSMAASLEVRAPFLDSEIFAVSSCLPDQFLIRGGIGKYILREAAKDWLPAEVFSHPKWGFAIPLHEYQNDRYREMALDLLAPGRNKLIDRLFERKPLDRIVQRGLTRKQDAADVSVFRASHQLWQLVQLAAWADEYGVEA
jgi:asparagine synthase (glutamine-hydrolysing)